MFIKDELSKILYVVLILYSCTDFGKTWYPDAEFINQFDPPVIWKNIWTKHCPIYWNGKAPTPIKELTVIIIYNVTNKHLFTFKYFLFITLRIKLTDF